MESVALNLVVLRSGDIKKASEFYAHLGLKFKIHRHGSGPEHYAAELQGGVFELYPQSNDGPSTLGTRIGFAVASVDSVVAGLTEYPDAIVSAPKDSEWGRRAVLKDPDGHRVELLQR